MGSTAAEAVASGGSITTGSDAWVHKLQHPLRNIRAHALARLLFKLRQGLMPVEGASAALVPLVLPCLNDVELELNALCVLQLLVQAGDPQVLASLQANGAALQLQRASIGNRPEMQSAYEKLLQQIYVTASAAPSSAPVRSRATLETEQHVQEQANEDYNEELRRSVRARVSVIEQQPDAIVSDGWRFAQVALASVDEQCLFEFEVKLQLRTTIPEIVAMCDTFRTNLLRNFPPEVFLQRPAVLQYLLQLVQQPLIASVEQAALDTTHSVVRKYAFSAFPYGGNYFDSLARKPRHQTTAVLMASLQAIECFLDALSQSCDVCLDPANVVYESTPAISFLDSYDARSRFYPRAMTGDDANDVPASTSNVHGFSLSGAIYKVFMGLLPILRSRGHPHLQVANVLHAAVAHLGERSGSKSNSDSVNKLDKQRIESIFQLIGDVLGRSCANSKTIEQELSSSVFQRVMELVMRLLQMYPSSCYRLSKQETTDDESFILVPMILWGWVRSCLTSKAIEDAMENDWGQPSLVEHLTEIDATIPSFLQSSRHAQTDALSIQAFLAHARAHDGSRKTKDEETDVKVMNLIVSQKVLNALPSLNDEDALAGVNGTLQVLSILLHGELSDNDLDEESSSLQSVVSSVLQMLTSPPASRSRKLSTYLLRELAYLLSKEQERNTVEKRHQFVWKVLCEPSILMYLLLLTASSDVAPPEQTEVNEEADVLWQMMKVIVNELSGIDEGSGDLMILRPVIPMLQHFSYLDLSEKSPVAQRSTQPQLVELVNRVDKMSSDADRLLLIARCLLHTSSYIRQAASSGVLSLLSRMDPESVEHLTSREEAERERIVKDPFGVSPQKTEYQVSMETRIMEIPLPVFESSQENSADRLADTSAVLTKLARLHKVLTGSVVSALILEAGIKEVATLLENVSPSEFALLEELGNVDNIVDVVMELLRPKSVGKTEVASVQLIPHALSVLRVVVLRSRVFRDRIRADTDLLTLLLGLAFHAESKIRALMFYIILHLTCSTDIFASQTGLPGVSSDLNSVAWIPAHFKQTFGLYSSRWSRCFVRVRSLTEMLKEAMPAWSKEANVIWLSAVLAAIERPTSADIHAVASALSDDAEGTESSLLHDERFVLQKLRSARSHSSFLDAMYHLIQLCQASPCVCRSLGTQWETEFERYLGTEPTCERDEVVVSAVVRILTAILSDMERMQQLRVFMVTKRLFIPRLQRPLTSICARQILCLLVHLSESDVADVFLSLAADTDILTWLRNKYTSLYSTDPLLNVLVLQLLLRFISQLGQLRAQWSSEPFANAIAQRLALFLPLLMSTIARHRVPGSFLERDVFAVASQCFAAMLRIIPRSVLAAANSTVLPGESYASGSLQGKDWSTRFLFDHVSRMRVLGFAMLKIPIDDEESDASEITKRHLELAFAASNDNAESDAVRGEACGLLFNALEKYEHSSPMEQAQLELCLGGSNFASHVVKAFADALQSDKLRVRCGSAYACLIRLLLVKREALGPVFGDIVDVLRTAENEGDIYPLVVKTLSLQFARAAYTRYSAHFLQLPNPCDKLWKQSVLPAMLRQMKEVLLLLQVLFEARGGDLIQYFVLRTALKYQIIELLAEAHSSLKIVLEEPVASSEMSELARLHYDGLDGCAGVLMMLHVSPSAHSSSIPDSSKEQARSLVTPASLSENDLFKIIAELMDSRHPTTFRQSFVRLAIALIIKYRPMFAACTPAMKKDLCISTLDLYREMSEHCLTSLSSDNESVASGARPLSALRRIASAVQVMVESDTSLRQLVLVRQGLQFCVARVKDGFHAIRMAGGFGSKSKAATHDESHLDISTRIQIHLDVVTALIGGDWEGQEIASREQIPDMLLSSWTVMQMAHARGSCVLLSALHLLTNYVYTNENAKASCVVPSSAPIRRAGSSQAKAPQTLLLVVTQIVIQRSVYPESNRVSDSSAVDIPLHDACSSLLSSLVVNSECLQWMIRFGLVASLVNIARDQLKREGQTTKKSDPKDSCSLSNILGVLASVACTEDGRQTIASSAGNELRDIFDDILQSANEDVLRCGSRLLRNLAFATNQLSVWEACMNSLVSCLEQRVEIMDDPVGQHLSCVLWSLVCDNQKAKAMLLARPNTVRRLETVVSKATRRQHDTRLTDELGENLKRVLLAMQAQ